jgi:hypothetical protein
MEWEPVCLLAKDASERLGWEWEIVGTAGYDQFFYEARCAYGEWAEYDDGYRFMPNEERPVLGVDELLAILHGRFLLTTITGK